MDPQANFCAMCSSRISRTVSGIITMCSRRKNASISVSVSREKSKPTKKPFFRRVRIRVGLLILSSHVAYATTRLVGRGTQCRQT
jgi:hypothetical protein